jgi:4-hydroxy-4-methyl-2-oxoglutarate aldolase
MPRRRKPMDRNENQELLELFKGLRVCDVRDGMDWIGYHFYGSLDRSFRPLFRTQVVVGIARTARYLPYEGPVVHCTPDEYTVWVKKYYAEIMPDPWMYDIEPGDFMCLDNSGVDVGTIGSNNSLMCKKRGNVGFLVSGSGLRDTDELIIQKIPIWYQTISLNMSQCRLRYHEKDVPIAIGGVAIYPGDLVVGDGDGVIVVPRKVARDVAKYARQENDVDRASRKEKYLDMGIELDGTV